MSKYLFIVRLVWAFVRAIFRFGILETHRRSQGIGQKYRAIVKASTERFQREVSYLIERKQAVLASLEAHTKAVHDLVLAEAPEEEIMKALAHVQQDMHDSIDLDRQYRESEAKVETGFSVRRVEELLGL